MASPNRIKASSAKELALPTSLALVSHVLSDAKQTRAGRKSSPPYPPFCRRANTSVFRFESTQRARTRPASLSPKSSGLFSPFFLIFLFYDGASDAQRRRKKKRFPAPNWAVIKRQRKSWHVLLHLLLVLDDADGCCCSWMSH